MNYHTFILKESGELFVFGHNNCGQLGLGDNNSRNKPTLLTSLMPLAQVESKIAKIPYSTDPTIRQIVCGRNHSFILKESGELFAFGGNDYGELGLGDNDNRNVPTLLMIDNNIVSINGVKTEKTKWDPKKYFTLSDSKKRIIKNFLLVCHYYKKKYNINMVRYMRHFIISLLF